MLLFVGQIPFEETDRESFQEVDYRKMFAPAGEWVTQIDDARRIPEIVAHARDVAMSGRPGPVVIAISEEMQKHLVEVADIGPAEVAPPHPDPAALGKMQAMLAKAQKPIAILGGSCWTESGRAAIRELPDRARSAGYGRLPATGRSTTACATWRRSGSYWSEQQLRRDPEPVEQPPPGGSSSAARTR